MKGQIFHILDYATNYCTKLVREWHSRFRYCLVLVNSGDSITMDTKVEQSNQVISHKGEKRNSYSIEFKKDVVEDAKENSNNSALDVAAAPDSPLDAGMMVLD